MPGKLLGVIAVLAMSVGVISPAHACDGAGDQLLGGLCTVAWPDSRSFNNSYMPANGAVLQVQSYNALFSLLGYTYGGDGKTTFALPDLRGRMVLGAGTRAGVTYAVGAKQDVEVVVMQASNLPAHAHQISSNGAQVVVNSLSSLMATQALGGLTATTTLTGAGGAANLSGVAYAVTSNNLVLNGSNAGSLSNSPGNASLGKPSSPNIYSANAPSVTMAGASIGGSVTLNAGAAPAGTLSGALTASLGSPGTVAATLTGAPAVAVPAAGANTGPAGTGMAMPVLPPYAVVQYYIAYMGLYPSFN